MSDEFRSAPAKPPVQCIRCKGTAVVLSQAKDPRTKEPRWRYRCLDDGVAWWQDEHGGDPDEYIARNP